MQSRTCNGNGTNSAARGAPVDMVKPQWLVVLSHRTCASTAVHKRASRHDAALLKRRRRKKRRHYSARARARSQRRPTFKFAPVSESLLSHLYHKRYAVMVSCTLLLRVFVRDWCSACISVKKRSGKRLPRAKQRLHGRPVSHAPSVAVVRGDGDGLQNVTDLGLRIVRGKVHQHLDVVDAVLQLVLLRGRGHEHIYSYETRQDTEPRKCEQKTYRNERVHAAECLPKVSRFSLWDSGGRTCGSSS
jgi:hypothetical protein